MSDTPNDLPMQPVHRADDGMIRFKKNRIVRDLLDFASTRGMDMNELACGDYTDQEREQFAQLIGYSISGYSELSYVSDASYQAASAAADVISDKPHGPSSPSRTPTPHQT